MFAYVDFLVKEKKNGRPARIDVEALATVPV